MVVLVVVLVVVGAPGAAVVVLNGQHVVPVVLVVVGPAVVVVLVVVVPVVVVPAVQPFVSIDQLSFDADQTHLQRPLHGLAVVVVMRLVVVVVAWLDALLMRMNAHIRPIPGCFQRIWAEPSEVLCNQPV